MFIKYIILACALWSWDVYAIPHDPFTLIDLAGKSECDQSVISNMPRVRSQDSLPICGAMSSSTVVQFEMCKIKKIQDCSKIERKDEVSPFSTLAWMYTNTGEGVHEVQNHKNLKIYSGGRGARAALLNSGKNFSFKSDACFPIDQFAVDFGDTKDREAEDIFKKIETAYSKYKADYDKWKKKKKTEGEFCEECLLQSSQEMGTSMEKLGMSPSLQDLQQKIDKAVKRDANSSQFLFDLTMGSCRDAVVVDSEDIPTIETFPQNMAKKIKDQEQLYKSKNKNKTMPSEDKQKFAYNLAIDKIKDVLLNTKKPMTFDGICLNFQDGECKTGHSVVISGYKKVCKQQSCNIECREMIKIQNSWGADWQEHNADGWVDAKSLLSYVTEEPKRMENVLSWYQ